MDQELTNTNININVQAFFEQLCNGILKNQIKK